MGEEGHRERCEGARIGEWRPKSGGNPGVDRLPLPTGGRCSKGRDRGSGPPARASDRCGGDRVSKGRDAGRVDSSNGGRRRASLAEPGMTARAAMGLCRAWNAVEVGRRREGRGASRRAAGGPRAALPGPRGPARDHCAGFAAQPRAREPRCEREKRPPEGLQGDFLPESGRTLSPGFTVPCGSYGGARRAKFCGGR